MTSSAEQRFSVLSTTYGARRVTSPSSAPSETTTWAPSPCTYASYSAATVGVGGEGAPVPVRVSAVAATAACAVAASLPAPAPAPGLSDAPLEVTPRVPRSWPRTTRAHWLGPRTTSSSPASKLSRQCSPVASAASWESARAPSMKDANFSSSVAGRAHAARTGLWAQKAARMGWRSDMGGWVERPGP